jgi:hypothetical protein
MMAYRSFENVAELKNLGTTNQTAFTKKLGADRIQETVKHYIHSRLWLIR